MWAQAVLQTLLISILTNEASLFALNSVEVWGR
jgi:hypothetical protein